MVPYSERQNSMETNKMGLCSGVADKEEEEEELCFTKVTLFIYVYIYLFSITFTFIVKEAFGASLTRVTRQKVTGCTSSVI